MPHDPWTRIENADMHPTYGVLCFPPMSRVHGSCSFPTWSVSIVADVMDPIPTSSPYLGDLFLFCQVKHHTK